MKSKLSRVVTLASLLAVFGFLLYPISRAQGIPHYNDLTWTVTANAGLTSQKVYRATSAGGLYASIATLGPTVTSFKDSAVTLGTTHCYVLTELVGTSESVFGSEVCVVDKGTNVNPQTGLAVTSQ